MRECNCSQCPGFYLGAHKCRCSCHARQRDPLAPVSEIEDDLAPGDQEGPSEPENATEAPWSEGYDPTDAGWRRKM